MNGEQIIIPQEKPLSVAVTVHDRQVVLHLSEPREFIALTGDEPVIVGTQMLSSAVIADPSTGGAVIDFAMTLIDLVYETRGDLKPAGGAVKHELIERHRATLTKRLEIVMNSTREKKTVNNRSLARQLVDIALAEVFA